MAGLSVTGGMQFDSKVWRMLAKPGYYNESTGLRPSAMNSAVQHCGGSFLIETATHDALPTEFGKEASAPLVVSVVTPSLNQGQYLDQAIRSVLSQEGDFFIEYMIMDGRSTDDSVEVIRHYEEVLRSGSWKMKCRGISYSWISETDRGQSHALNKGFDRATGDVGVWLNSDDYFLNPAVFDTVTTFFRNDDNLGLIVGNGRLVSENGEELGNYATANLDLKELLYLDWHIHQPSAFFRMNCFKKHRFDDSLYYCMDVDFFLAVLTESNTKWLKTADFYSASRMYPQCKTSSGGAARWREQNRVLERYATNPVMSWLGSAYRWIDIVYKDRNTKNRVRFKICRWVRKLAYHVILGSERP